jgi:hypothetical protein
LVDFALRIPGEYRVTPAESKRLFRRAISGIVPDFVLSRPKRGFQMPLADWFRGPLRPRIEALRSPTEAMAPFVSRHALARLIKEHSVGRRDHSAILWRLIVLDHWLASFSDGRLGRPPRVRHSDAVWSAGRPMHGDAVPGSPPSVADLFLRSEAQNPPLRVGVLVDENGIPGYARRIFESIQATNYCDLAAVIVARQTADERSLDRTKGFALKAYETLIEPRSRSEPDPLAPVDCDDLLGNVSRVTIEATDSNDGRSFAAKDLEALRGLELDVLVDFGCIAPRGASLPEAKRGVWRYHFGDRTQYPRGSGFLRELIDGRPLSGIELIRLGPTMDFDVTILRAEFSTAPFLSSRDNRFAPIWGACHFVPQALWDAHQRPVPVESRRSTSNLPPPTVDRVPSNAEVVRWMTSQARRRSNPLRERLNGPVDWQIAIRRSQVPLYVDASIAALKSFRWLEADPGCHRADPVVMVDRGQTWLFFEETVEPREIGRITCGRITSEGELVETRPVLQKPYHLSFPQIVEAEGEIFMLPETAQNGGLDLYRARRFPDEWSFETRLLNFPCVDSSIFQAGSSWWMMTSPRVVPGHAPITWLLRSASITGPWRFQPGGLVAASAAVARGGGGVLRDGTRLIRPSQDCSSVYGRALLFNEILAIEDKPYQEQTICRIDANWMPGLATVHSYSRAGDWEAIDGGFRSTRGRRRRAA